MAAALGTSWHPFDSFNGQRPPPYYNPYQPTFIAWFSSNAFWGSNYSNTPVGAVTHIDEPGGGVENAFNYYYDWASGKSFAITAWHALYTSLGGAWVHCAVVGDPFVTK